MKRLLPTDAPVTRCWHDEAFGDDVCETIYPFSEERLRGWHALMARIQRAHAERDAAQDAA